jgi:hypothetical protein
MQKTERNRARLLEGPVGPTLFNLAVPMVFGILSMVAYNLADTFFVGRLGRDQLAALSFTFPVVLTIGSLAQGLYLVVSAGLNVLKRPLTAAGSGSISLAVKPLLRRCVVPNDLIVIRIELRFQNMAHPPHGGFPFAELHDPLRVLYRNGHVNVRPVPGELVNFYVYPCHLHETRQQERHLSITNDRPPLAPSAAAREALRGHSARPVGPVAACTAWW